MDGTGLNGGSYRTLSACRVYYAGKIALNNVECFV